MGTCGMRVMVWPTNSVPPSITCSGGSGSQRALAAAGKHNIDPQHGLCPPSPPTLSSARTADQQPYPRLRHNSIHAPRAPCAVREIGSLALRSLRHHFAIHSHRRYRPTAVARSPPHSNHVCCARCYELARIRAHLIALGVGRRRAGNGGGYVAGGWRAGNSLFNNTTQSQEQPGGPCAVDKLSTTDCRLRTATTGGQVGGRDAGTQGDGRRRLGGGLGAGTRSARCRARELGRNVAEAHGSAIGSATHRLHRHQRRPWLHGGGRKGSTAQALGLNGSPTNKDGYGWGLTATEIGCTLGCLGTEPRALRAVRSVGGINPDDPLRGLAKGGRERVGWGRGQNLSRRSTACNCPDCRELPFVDELA